MSLIFLCAFRFPLQSGVLMSLRGMNRINNLLSSNSSVCEPRVMLSAPLPEASRATSFTGTVSDSDVVNAVQPGLDGQGDVPSVVETIRPTKARIDYAANQGIQSISDGLLSRDSAKVKRGQNSLTFARRLVERSGASASKLAQFDRFVVESVRALVNQGSSQNLGNAAGVNQPVTAQPTVERAPVAVQQSANNNTPAATDTATVNDRASSNRISTRLVFDENGNAVLIVNEANGEVAATVNVVRR